MPTMAQAGPRLRERSRTQQVTEAIEPLRRDKVVGSSLEAEVTVPSATPGVTGRAVHRLGSPPGRCEGREDE